jgi:hypothetical protein
MARAALFISIVAVLISAVALGWQVYRYWWEQDRHVEVTARALTVSENGEVSDVVGVLVSNSNPRYPIRVGVVAFTPPSEQVPKVWFARPTVIDPHDAATIDVHVDDINETGEPLGDRFVAWVLLTTGERYRSNPHPSPR